MNSTLTDETKRMLILSEMPDSVIREEMANGNPLAGEAAAHKGIERYGVPIALGITAVPAATAFGLGAAVPVIADTALPAVGAAVNWAAGTAPGQTLTATAGSPLLWGSLAVENAAEKTYRNIRYGEPITWNDVAQTGIDMALATLPPESVGYEALRRLNNEGFDWFVDFGVENQFSTGNPFYVKNLVGNNGAFSINDINWFHDKGGELRKQ